MYESDRTGCDDRCLNQTGLECDDRCLSQTGLSVRQMYESDRTGSADESDV